MSNQKFVDAELQKGESIRQSNQLKSQSEIQTIADNYFTTNPNHRESIHILENGDVFLNRSLAYNTAKSWGVKLYICDWQSRVVKDLRIQITAIKDGVLQTFTP
jgi:hypothetical protein